MQRHIRWQQHASFIVFILTYNYIMDSWTRMSKYLWNCKHMSLYEVANLSWYHKICMIPKIYIVSSTLFISYVLFHFLLYYTYHVIRIHMFYSPFEVVCSSSSWYPATTESTSHNVNISSWLTKMIREGIVLGVFSYRSTNDTPLDSF